LQEPPDQPRKDATAHAEAISRIGMLMRGIGAQSAMTSAAVASRFGLNTTDLECLDLIVMRGPVTAGALAQAVGLTPGSVTVLIDRLERAGYAERIRGASDRRQVLVQARPGATAAVAAVYRGMEERLTTLWRAFSPRDLALIETFLARTLDEAAAATRQIVADGNQAPADADGRLPRQSRRRT